ncbi:MAG TPA: hypothetical protein VG796_13275 [Verrucomicrobiales bacterium]|nr:hypothetical protein [Verrucomicrobiales bacterium]
MNEKELNQLKAEKEAANAGKAEAHPVGTGTGAAGGALAGAAIGAVGGPVGAFMGAAIGAIAGGNTGLNAAEAVEESEPARDARKPSVARKPNDTESTAAEFDLPARSSPNVRDDLNEGGFSGVGQRQKES